MYNSRNETIRLIRAHSLGDTDRSCLSDFLTEMPRQAWRNELFN